MPKSRKFSADVARRDRSTGSPCRGHYYADGYSVWLDLQNVGSEKVRFRYITVFCIFLEKASLVLIYSSFQGLFITLTKQEMSKRC